MAQLLAGQPIVLNDGTTVDAGDYLKDKVVAIYFSAMWCPPCRAFTPKLKKFYEELKEAGKNFEVIFVSRDRSAEDLKEYYNDHHGRWVYIEFGDPKIAELLEKFAVKTIPTCRLIKPDGTVVVQDARTEIQEKGQENALELWDEWKNLNENVLNSSNTSSKGSGSSVGTVTQPIQGPISLREFIDQIQDELPLTVESIQCGPSGWSIAFIEQKHPTYFGQNLFDAFQELYREYAPPWEDLEYYEHEQGLRLVFKVDGTDTDDQEKVNHLVYHLKVSLKHKRMKKYAGPVVIRCGLDTIEELLIYSLNLTLSQFI